MRRYTCAVEGCDFEHVEPFPSAHDLAAEVMREHTEANPDHVHFPAEVS